MRRQNSASSGISAAMGGFDFHFVPDAASSFLGGQLVSCVLYIHSSMLMRGHVHELGSTVPVAMESLPGSLSCCRSCSSQWERGFCHQNPLFLLEYSCKTVWNVNTVAWVVEKYLNYCKIPGLAFG